MAVDFDTFKASCDARDYSRVYKEGNVNAMFTNNGVKIAVRSKQMIVGFGSSKEDVETIRTVLTENNFQEERSKRRFTERKDGFVYLQIPINGDPLDQLWDIVGLIEAIPTIVKKVRGLAIKPFTKEICERNIFEKIAKRFRFAIDSEDGYMLDNTRGLLEGDSIDYLITIGESVNRTNENTYREHIVPCIMIFNRAVTMTMEGHSVTAVAQMIKNNLAIVLITNEEAELLDGELDMQTTMPEGWTFGDSVFARLDTAGIKLK
jgi:hypothetical protein